MPLTDFHSALDLRLFHAVNATGGGRLLDRTMQLLSMRAFDVAIGFALCALVLARLRRAAARPMLALALAIFTSDFVGSHLLKPLFGRMRPCYALARESFRWLAPAGNVPSLPSLHASNMFALALVISLAMPRLAAVAYLAAVAVSFSRVYVGVHWPTDVLAGMVWGTLAGALGWAIAAGRLRRMAAPRPTPEHGRS